MFFEVDSAGYAPYRKRFKRRYRFRFGDDTTSSFSVRDFHEIEAAQACHPILVATATENRRYWWYGGVFYVEDEGLFVDAIRTRVFKRHIHRRKQVERADRIPRISPDVLLEVWDRDGGRCTRCASGVDLHFERRLAISEQGSSEPSNLRVVCSRCMRASGGTSRPSVAPPQLAAQTQA